jgi:hypothetical protein
MAATPKNDGDGEPAQEETELDRFLNLAGKLVRVPKREIDAEQAKEDEREAADRDGRHSLPVSPA